MSEGIRIIGEDPHIWVSPEAVKKSADNICRALIAIDPSGKTFFTDNLKAFVLEIESLDREIKAMLGGKKGWSFIISHPALGYFCAEYGLQQIAIETEGKSPSASHIKYVIDTARQKKIKTILVQKRV